MNNNKEEEEECVFITIGNYNFCLESKNISNNLVLISSEKCNSNNNGNNCISNNNTNSQNTSFIVYRSNSNTGFWRLCMNKINNGQFDYRYKGNDDYIQQTFVNLQLQKFINDNLMNIKDNTLEDTISCNFNYISKLRDFNIIENIEKHINNKNRKLFFNYSKDEINKCGKKKYNPILLINFSKLLSNNYTVEYLKTIYENYSFKYINKDFQYEINGNIYSVNLIKQTKHNNTLHKKKNNNNNNINNTFKQLDLFFFNSKSNNSKFTKKNNNKTKIPLVLYFLNYNLTLTKNINPINSTTIFKNQYIPILLTYNKSKITKYGLYSNYIRSGNYICKVFDYTSQCSTLEKEKHCFGEYTYIGDRYNKLFPFEDKIMSKIKEIK